MLSVAQPGSQKEQPALYEYYYNEKIFKSIEAIQKRKLIHIFMVKSQRRWYNNCIKQQTAKVLTAILSITVASAGRLLRGWCDYEH